jgi:hypothetical protein
MRYDLTPGNSVCWQFLCEQDLDDQLMQLNIIDDNQGPVVLRSLGRAIGIYRFPQPL